MGAIDDVSSTHPLASEELLALQEAVVLLSRPPAAAQGVGVLLLPTRLVVSDLVELVVIFLQPVVAFVANVELCMVCVATAECEKRGPCTY